MYPSISLLLQTFMMLTLHSLNGVNNTASWFCSRFRLEKLGSTRGIYIWWIYILHVLRKRFKVCGGIPRIILHMIGISNLSITKVKRMVSLDLQKWGKCYTLSMHVFIGTTTMLFRKCKKPFRSLPGA